MSIQDHLAVLVSSGAVVPFKPHRPIRGKGRRLFLTADAWDEFNDVESAVNLLVGKGFVTAAMERWVIGDRIYGDQRGGRFLKQLDPPPDDIWELRVTEPVAQGRLFVIFPEPDTLLMTGLHTRRHLGKRNSQAWPVAMNRTQAAWSRLFPDLNPFRADIIDEYVTENCDAFPIRSSDTATTGTRGLRLRDHPRRGL